MLLLNRGTPIHHGIPDNGETATDQLPLVPTFTFVGRLVSTKGAQVFLNAARFLGGCGSAYRLKIVGDGPDRQKLERLVEDYQLRDCVQFLGYCSSDDLEETLKQTTALVVPSLAGEVFGLVVLENMLRRKCLIVSDIPPFVRSSVTRDYCSQQGRDRSARLLHASNSRGSIASAFDGCGGSRSCYSSLSAGENGRRSPFSISRILASNSVGWGDPVIC